MFDQVGNIEHHLPGVGPSAGNLLLQRREHPMHLHKNRLRFGLSLTLQSGAFAQPGKIFLARTGRRSIFGRVRTSIVQYHLQVHLSLAAQTFDICIELALIASDRASKGFVVGEHGPEAEWQYG